MIQERAPQPGRRSGSILIVAIWVVFFLAALVIVFARTVRTDILACSNEVATIQAASVERSAEQYVIALLDQQKDGVLTLAESYFAGVQVSGGYFWLFRPDYGDAYLPALGLVDEASKLNLNSASESQLIALPGMTPDIAASIIDWRDADSEASTGGAEDDYYLSLPRAYRAKNGPLETVEELLCIKDVTPELLYGTGLGSRYGADPTWGTGAGAGLQSDLQLARGIYDLVTVYSKEPSSDGGGGGSGRGGGGAVDVNDRNRNRLREVLTSTFGESRAEAILAKIGEGSQFTDLFDFGYKAGLTGEEFDSISGRITAGTPSSTAARINVNTAPLEVLICLGLSDADAAALVSVRQSNASTTGLGWVLDALGPKAAGLYNRITTTSNQYSADILAVSENGKAFRRCRIVLDVTSSPPRVVFRRDLTQAGWPLDPSILLSLREGQGVPAAYAGYGGAL